MKFAKVVFWIAGIWGVLVLAPLYFTYDLIGRQDPPAITHPGFYYGFVGVGLAWQLAFMVIATNPLKFRLMMLPSIFEKFSYGIAIALLVLHGRTRVTDLVFSATDILLGILFIVAFFKTRERSA